MGRGGSRQLAGVRLLVHAGRGLGLLAFEDGSPVGRVSVAPREEFVGICSPPQYGPRDQEDGIRSIVCFVALLDAAVEPAFAHGAGAVEAYPHAHDPRDSMGSTELHPRVGFVRHRDASTHVVEQAHLPDVFPSGSAPSRPRRADDAPIGTIRPHVR